MPNLAQHCPGYPNNPGPKRNTQHQGYCHGERNEPGREHDVAVLASFARLHADHHALAVNRIRRQADGLGDPQSRRIANGQDDPVLEALNRIKTKASSAILVNRSCRRAGVWSIYDTTTRWACTYVDLSGRHILSDVSMIAATWAVHVACMEI